MIIKNPKFEISAVKPAQYPKNDLPQIVLVGKSNVGKSSFINTMLNRKAFNDFLKMLLTYEEEQQQYY